MAETILIVDDEQDLRDLIADLLVEEGYACATAGSIREAEALLITQRAEGGNFTLIISDLHMPGGSGIELLKTLRSKGVSTPMLFLSGDIIDVELQPYLAMGVVGYQLKPFRTADFLKKLDGIFTEINKSVKT
jgi:CheY-like chemotaxis protein